MPSLMPQWRSLEELAADPAFIERVAAEFPGLAHALAEPNDRRRVLKLMGAAMAMAGLAGCGIGAPGGTLIPAVRAPPSIIPGLPNRYSTAHALSGYADGVVVTHHMGRPIKVEGNPDHPASLGATSAIGQASILGLYDPFRAQTIQRKREIVAWETAVAMLTARRSHLAERRSDGPREAPEEKATRLIRWPSHETKKPRKGGPLRGVSESGLDQALSFLSPSFLFFRCCGWLCC